MRDVGLLILCYMLNYGRSLETSWVTAVGPLSVGVSGPASGRGFSASSGHDGMHTVPCTLWLQPDLGCSKVCKPENSQRAYLHRVPASFRLLLLSQQSLGTLGKVCTTTPCYKLQPVSELSRSS